MATAFMTYAWADNDQGDVDFVVQELESAGLAVNLDRWVISAGHRLWQQIDTAITDPSRSDAWLIYATQASLSSEPCREELHYALHRALADRGEDFPIIAIFPDGSLDEQLIPSAIKTRLYVTLSDAEWCERVIASAEKRTPSIARPNLDPFAIDFHDNRVRKFIEVRPRAGTWAPFIGMIPAAEKQDVEPIWTHGAAGSIPSAAAMISNGEGVTDDGEWWYAKYGNQATPTQSYFLQCKRQPTKIAFGPAGGELFMITLDTEPNN